MDDLIFRPADPAYADELFPVMSDPAGWWFDPAARHADLARTRAWLARAAQKWAEDGLSYWTVFHAEGPLVGIGGAQRHRSGTWNLSYRIATEHQRKGYATRLARAGLDAAHAVDPDRAVIAWVLDENAPSRRVAQRLGLLDQGVRVDENDGVERRAYADRVLPPGPRHSGGATSAS